MSAQHLPLLLSRKNKPPSVSSTTSKTPRSDFEIATILKPERRGLDRFIKGWKTLATKGSRLKKLVSKRSASKNAVNILSLPDELLVQIADNLENADAKILEIIHPRFYTVCKSLKRERIDLYRRTRAERLKFNGRPAEQLHWRLADFMWPLVFVAMLVLLITSIMVLSLLWIEQMSWRRIGSVGLHVVEDEDFELEECWS